jgi:prepilin-type N-terminal cleavage/methylation domain-containing protein
VSLSCTFLRILSFLRTELAFLQGHKERLVWLRQDGLTLAETLVAVSMVGILMAGAMTGLGALAPKFNLDNGARTVAMTMNQARAQAITRGHRIYAIFYTGGFLTYDLDAWLANPLDEPPTEWGELPAHISVSTTIVGFSPLGTLIVNQSTNIPVEVTLANGDYTREVSVGLIGEVEIQ